MNFVAIDFETANPARVSACAIGIAVVRNGKIGEIYEYLISPVGGHAAFQSKIHGICVEHTKGKPDFSELYQTIKSQIGENIYGYSLFDKQVLNALIGFYNLDHKFRYTDVSAIAKKSIPESVDFRLPTMAKHFGVVLNRHHCAKDDAIACAEIAIRVNKSSALSMPLDTGVHSVFRGLLAGVLADGEVNYKEAAEILYWIEENPALLNKYRDFRDALYSTLEDGLLTPEEYEFLKVEINRARFELAVPE